MDTQRQKVLLIDPGARDRADVRERLSQQFDLSSSAAVQDGVRLASGSSPDLILLDLSLPELCDITVLHQLRNAGVRAPIVVLSPPGKVRDAVRAMKYGANDVLDGGASSLEISQSISDILAAASTEEAGLLTPQPNARRQSRDMHADFGPIAGRSGSMEALYKKVDQIAGRDTTILVTGESGTGKELVAREIHKRSLRRDGPFVAINCSAIPETLIESELFGHEKGAFTHAVERRLGQFELADGGTLFLDEIGELSLAVQVKLLRFLQEQEFFRVGRSKPVRVDVRVITATNRNLEDLARIQQFRQDLLYRINVINLHIPPLRDRVTDIPRIIEHCLRKLAVTYGARELTFTVDAMDALTRYPWPGNVRELENVIEGLLALAPSTEVSSRDLPIRIRERDVSDAERTIATVNASGLGFDDAERMFETDMNVRALQKANFIQTRAAEMLGISRRILKYKMDKLGINDRGEVLASTKGQSN